MLNKFPVWKYLLVLAVVAIGLLYASPNLYGRDPAIQVSGAKGADVDLSVVDKVNAILEKNNVTAKSTILEDGQILVRLKNVEEQLKAHDLLRDSLSDDYISAINMAPAQPAWLKAVGGNPMKLGLDLSGGVHFTMEIDMATAVDNQLEQMEQDFRSDLREEKLRYRSVRRVAGSDRMRVEMRTEADKDAAESFLETRYPLNVYIDDSSNDKAFFATMSEQKLKEIRDYAIKQNETIIRNRINQIGVAEPNVQRQGAERIIVQLPGIQDTARAKEILGATATLEFREVDENADISAAAQGRIPAGTEMIMSRDGYPVVLKKRIILEGSHITGAQSGADEYQRPQVSITLDSKGGAKMNAFTKRAIGKRMATVFIEYKPSGKKDADGKALPPIKVEEVINVATIQARLDRSFRITGIDNPAEAHNLSLLLRAGALVAPIQIVEERTVGPSLGQENIEAGMTAVALGFAFVLVFMLVYYKGFGMVANLALAANLVLIVGVMSLIPGATLTLPGIAGIVLTVGMAVDANVLIFERIREELADGRSPQQAIHFGYDSAFSTIFDANITTLIAAIILFAVGTGPIAGFAVTLAIGILTSMFTAIVGTRAVINLFVGGKRIDKLSI
ncbi:MULTISPECIES: protein translocase subunit SecD [Pseudoalteromonas]|uniref:Protein translocase subunit SecD n=2 Tax=Pseudoalteromonas arctica TaxID=394751 RepID=A0A290S8B9_9GAMM|nr:MULTISPECIES: protein translocase subunit SecD [Pseudoalteromonas]MBG9991182.1 protein translocase subunit SecD [Pseudoalteromonas sp. NZS37]MBH0034970.1 protein translocase subunit SecD [Pseudoalteromonas sp. NZS71_1]MBH0045368.1 protein translocase subunit SecD [Pseudoalteromonas sp. NZS11_1]MBH0050220.1 protein translocase subunit SecD [Pseudoalteromonas sp. SWYJZ19]MBH0081018.1 protein translocase subunit SecD [Pseudoalteromonas sp. NZS11]MBH0089533.1 protein translocase subunit SecD [